MTLEEWFVLFKWMLSFGKLNMTSAEFSMWHFLVSRTIGCRKFSVEMKNKDFRRVYHDETTYGLSTWGRKKVWSTLRDLKDKRFIWFDYEHGERFDHVINLPILVNDWKIKNLNTKEGLTVVLDKAVNEFMNHGYGFLYKRILKGANNGTSRLGKVV